MKKRLKIIAVFCLFLILSVVTLSPVANAQNMDKIRAKEKYANMVVKYCEKCMIPRYETYVFNSMEKIEVEKIRTDITEEFLKYTDGQITDELDIILYLVSLIIAFFYTVFGANGLSFSMCTATTFILMFIPIIVLSFVVSLVESAAFGVAGIFALFDAETIDDLLHMWGFVGCFFIFSILLPVFLLVYLLAVPIITVANMAMFFAFIYIYIDDNFPMP